MFQTTGTAAKTSTPSTIGRKARTGTFLVAASLLLVAGSAAQQSSSQESTPPPGTTTQGPRVTSTEKLQGSEAASYDNRYEIYGGLSFMNGQAGQNLPVRYNMGGGEVMGTYWLGDKLGVAADYRLEAGTTPLFPNPYYNRVLVYQNIFAGGVQYRGPKNRYAAVDYHALVGGASGTFDHAMKNYPGGSPISATNLGLYANHTSFWAAAGGSIDFNYTKNLAIRLSPDLIFEHFGTETREFVSVSGGVMYRFGKK